MGILEISFLYFQYQWNTNDSFANVYIVHSPHSQYKLLNNNDYRMINIVDVEALGKIQYRAVVTYDFEMFFVKQRII